MTYLEETCSSAADLDPCKGEPEHHLILYPGLLEAAFSASVLDTCLNFTRFRHLSFSCTPVRSLQARVTLSRPKPFETCNGLCGASMPGHIRISFRMMAAVPR